MGGEINWHGLEMLAEIHGVQDLEQLVTQLVAIRNTQRKAAD